MEEKKFTTLDEDDLEKVSGGTADDQKNNVLAGTLMVTYGREVSDANQRITIDTEG